MIRIFLTSSTDFTFDRAIAWAFDAANKSYSNVVRHLEVDVFISPGVFRGRTSAQHQAVTAEAFAKALESAIPKDRDLHWLEEWVQQEVSKFGEVDGNDVGGGKVNVFVHCRSAEKAAAKLSAALAGADFARDAVVAIGSEGGDAFKIVWPASADALLDLF